MLTKDLLKYSTRAERVYPKYLAPKDETILKMASDLGSIYERAVGRKLQELDDELKSYKKNQDAVFQGFRKLLDDRCEYGEQEDAIEEQRWRYFLSAENLRKGRQQTYEQFQGALAQEFHCSFERLTADLYADLPEFRTISGFEPCSAEALIHRYNASQIQGLLLRAQNLKMTIKDRDVLRRRRFLQKLRFWRLMAEFDDVGESQDLVIEISGPLAIFETSQTYGMRLCNFFPYLLLMSSWSLEADLKLGEKRVKLQVDSTKPISSHYRDFTGHIPQEFKALISAFNQLPEDERRFWLAEEGVEVLNLGNQMYSVPDMSFRSPNGPAFHLEIFHKWNAIPLKRRLQAMGKTPEKSLIIAVSQDLSKDPEIQKMIEKIKGYGQSILSFKRFPTPKAILTYLS